MTGLDLLKQQFNGRVRFRERRPGVLQVLAPMNRRTVGQGPDAHATGTQGTGSASSIVPGTASISADGRKGLRHAVPQAGGRHAYDRFRYQSRREGIFDPSSRNEEDWPWLGPAPLRRPASL